MKRIIQIAFIAAIISTSSMMVQQKDKHAGKKVQNEANKLTNKKKR